MANKNKDEIYPVILLSGIFIGVILTVMIMTLFNFKVHLSQDTADDICHNLTNNNSTIGSSEDGKLICSLPSYDHTQNIIIKENSK